MFKSFALALRGCAFCLLAGTSLAQQPATQPLKNEMADRVAWRQRVLALPRPTGCFTAKYPSEKWEVTLCGKAVTPSHERLTAPKVKQPAPGGESVAGHGNDVVATAVGGPITSVEAFFPHAGDIQTVTSIKINANGTENDLVGGYSLQINTQNFFSTPTACANATDASKCSGWLQFLFMNDSNGSFAGMEFWLNNFGPTCPGHGSIPQLSGMPQGQSWGPAGGNGCTFYFETPLLAQQPITVLGNLRMRAEVIGGQDSVTITFPDGTINGVAASDEILNLAPVWTEVEFNVLGYVNGMRAHFNQGAGVVAQVDVENGTTNAPTLSNSGSTGETNTFNLVLPGCANGGNPPNIEFAEVVPPAQASQSCPPTLHTAPPPSDCPSATEAVTALEKRVAAAQAFASGPSCRGPAHFDCELTVRTDQSELNAAIIYKNKVCKP